MKTRNGFVSNSSTTSFTCEICKNVTEYPDCSSLEENGGIRCVQCQKKFHISCFENEYEKPDVENKKMTFDTMYNVLTKLLKNKKQIQDLKDRYDRTDNTDTIESLESDIGDVFWDHCGRGSIINNCPVCNKIATKNNY